MYSEEILGIRWGFASLSISTTATIICLHDLKNNEILQI